MVAADQLPYIARICRLVEGLPLGIELAAAWVRLLSFQEITRESIRIIVFSRRRVQAHPKGTTV